MTERRLRLQIGLFVLVAMVLLAALIILFGSVPSLFKRSKEYTIRFSSAPGVSSGTPVRQSGVRIGEVRDVVLDDETGDVRVRVAIDKQYTVRRNQVPTLGASLLGGDATIDFIPQVAEKDKPPPDRSPVPPGSELVGVSQATVREVVPSTQEALNDVRKSMKRIEQAVPAFEDAAKNVGNLAADARRTNTEVLQLTQELRRELPDARATLQDVGAAARQLNRLSERADVLLQTNQDKLIKTVDNLNTVLTRAGNVLSEENQRNFSAALKNVRAGSQRLESIADNTNEVLQEGKKVLRRLDGTLERTDRLLNYMEQVTKPFAERAPGLARNFDESLDKLNRTLSDVRELVRVIGEADGTFRRILTDPSLYNRLDEAICTVTKMLPRLDRILKDFETFADKLARHPEKIGVGGAIRPDSGIK
jgi:phospholipid/cholesterol/gamma-HCH transport system substrate-binding protein